MPGSRSHARHSLDRSPNNPFEEEGNLFTFKRAKWQDPVEGETDTRAEIKFSRDKTTNRLECTHQFCATEEGNETPELFPQWLNTCWMKALAHKANLNNES